MTITQDQIRIKITSDPRWAEHALVTLLGNQTSEEQSARMTKDLNGIGFNGCDATILTSFAQQIERGQHLSAKQLAIAFKKLGKYAGQLYRIAQAKNQSA